MQEFRRGIKDYTLEVKLRQSHYRCKIKMIVRVLGRVIEIGDMDERDLQTTPFARWRFRYCIFLIRISIPFSSLSRFTSRAVSVLPK
jgi:hypothetical protein